MTLLIALASGAALGCDEAEAEGDKAAEAPQAHAQEEAAPAEQLPQPLPGDAERQVKKALDSYERIRAALVDDSGEIAVPARELAKAARAASADAPAHLRPHLTAMAAEAAKLADAPAADLDPLRKQFGELSRATLRLLSAHRPFAEGLHVFECGMADGYDKWVQRSDDISNPYMGTRMPACGSRSNLEST